MWLELEEFEQLMRGAVSHDELIALSSVCDELMASRIVLHFRIDGCPLVRAIEMLILYTPLTGLVKPVWVRVRLDPKVSASRILSAPQELREEDIKLSLGSEEVSITVRFHGRAQPFRDMLRRILRAAGLEECANLNLTYDGFTVIGSER